MPHLYLPSEHTDADLVLAADVATAVASADLYVAWTLDAGHGAPEIEAVMREEPAPATTGSAFAGVLVALMRGVAAVWHHLTAAPAQRTAQPRLTGEAGRPAGEPSL